MRARATRIEDIELSDRWDCRYNPAVRELLDHLARELAEEYVRLMKEAAQREAER